MNKYEMFIGRWQPFHRGHEWLIDQQLAKGKLILIMIRDVRPDGFNPLTAMQVLQIIKERYKDHKGRVIAKIIPDIASVNWGRGVGYECIEHEPPDNIQTISASEVRRRLKAGDESWKEFIDPSIVLITEKSFGRT